LVELSSDLPANRSLATGRPRSWLFEARGLATILLPGLYAWGATVAWPAFSAHSASALARLAAVLAAVALLSGPWVARRRLLLGRSIGVLGFVGLSAAAWGALESELRAPHLDAVRAALGAVAWGLFALGWGGFPGRTHLPEDDPHALVAARLPPRDRLSVGLGLAFSALLVTALALPLLAWRVERAGVALLAHAAALAGSVALLSVGSRVLLTPKAVGRGASPRLWLWLFVFWFGAGVLVWMS
jgi:hypothetical protein